jgi:hypothetical protein
MVANISPQNPETELSCPCGKASRSQLERIPRGVLVKAFLFWLPVKRYRCLKCKKSKLVLKKSSN